jgi:hypothetical protein
MYLPMRIEGDGEASKLSSIEVVDIHFYFNMAAIFPFLLTQNE